MTYSTIGYAKLQVGLSRFSCNKPTCIETDGLLDKLKSVISVYQSSSKKLTSGFFEGSLAAILQKSINRFIVSMINFTKLKMLLL